MFNNNRYINLVIRLILVLISIFVYFYFVFSNYYGNGYLFSKSLIDAEHKLNPQYNSLLNFKLQPIGLCDYDTVREEFIFIYSYMRPDRFDKRNAIRATWGNRTLFPQIRVAFIMGQSNDSSLNKKIEIESKQYGDIVQSEFIESYTNLTYKLLTAFKWTAKYCSNAKYIVRIHEDIFLNTFNLMKFFNQTLKWPGLAHSRTVLCNVVKGSRIHRVGTHTVSNEDRQRIFQGYNDIYPDYCGGESEIMSGDLIKEFYLKSFQTPFFWIDDVFEGLIAEKINSLTFVNINHSGYIQQKPDLILLNHKKFYYFIRIEDKSIDAYYSIWNYLILTNH